MKNKIFKYSHIKHLTQKTLVVLTAVAMATGGTIAFYQAHPVFADRLTDQINAAEAEIDKYEKEVDRLRRQGNSLQNALATLAVEKSAIQARVNQNEDKRKKLIGDIEETKKDIKKNQEVLGTTLSDLYVDDTLTPIEMLASSSSIGDYVDKQEYRTSVRDQLNVAILRIKELRKKLDGQKAQVESVIADLENQKARLAAKENERRILLKKTQGQEARYAAQASERRAEVEKLRAEQAAAMAAAGGYGGIDYSGYSAYPFMNSSMDYDDNCVYYSGGSAADPWGYCKRQCTSYVAWKLAKDGKSGFEGLGHAIAWSTGGTDFRGAQRGDAIVWEIGTYGHVMYVESKTASGLSISQFNVPYDSGRYSTKFYDWGTLESGAYSIRRF